jgi:hypothetical protein
MNTSTRYRQIVTKWVDKIGNVPLRVAGHAAVNERSLANVLLRLSVVLAAAFILYARTPLSFTRPQFWAEDGMFFIQNYFDGWKELFIPSGYLLTIPRIPAMVAGYFDPAVAPAIYNYFAISLTLIVVWLATSPRLELPLRPLLALAIVLVPSGGEVLGTICNAQWVVPIGAFVLLLMRPAESALVLGAEALFVALMAFTGPVSIFLAPIFLLRTMLLRRDPKATYRLVILTALVVSGAITQGLCILANMRVNFLDIAPVAYPSNLWFELPLMRVAESFGPKAVDVFSGGIGLITASAAATLAVVFAMRPPYRMAKIFMLIFALGVMYSGMLKFHQNLDVLKAAGQRYFYIGSVLLLWFICCALRSPGMRTACGILVAIVELNLIMTTADTPRARTDLEWPIWASFIYSGLPVSIPIDPVGWFLDLPANAGGGPLARFVPWIGDRLDDLVASQDEPSCTGKFTLLAPLDEIGGAETRWIANGQAWNIRADRPAKLIVLVDSQQRVLGFGFPGFALADDPSKPPLRSGWIGIFSARAGESIQAYAVTESDRQLCPIGSAPSHGR